jgi:hypothetical protein
MDAVANKKISSLHLPGIELRLGVVDDNIKISGR